MVIAQFNTEQPGAGYDASEVRIAGADLVVAQKSWERGEGGTVVSMSNYSTGNGAVSFYAQVRRVSSDDILYCNSVSVIALQRKY